MSQNIYQSQDLKCLVAVAVLVVQVGMNMYTDLKKSRQIQCLMLSVMTEKAFFVNTAYVVNAENYKLVITELDISAWASRTNKIIEETTEKYFSLIEDDEYVTLV